MKIIISSIIVALILFVFQPVLLDGYCIIYPHIGTKFLTKEFSMAKFKNIKEGYTKYDVENRLGITNDIRKRKNCYVCNRQSKIPDNTNFCAYYSKQNSWLWGTIAFEVFVIFYDENFVVIEKQQCWYFD